MGALAGDTSVNALPAGAGAPPLQGLRVVDLSTSYAGPTASMYMADLGEPKGVMNTHQTLRAVLDNWVHLQGRESLGEPVVNLIASPVGHHTGFLWGVLLTTLLRGTAVYLDRWVPSEAPRVIREEKVTTMFSAPTFLQDLLQTELATEAGCSLRTVVLAGAPVPRTLPATAGTAFGCFVCPAWGMTELGIGISCAPHLPPDALVTDGLAVPGTEARIVGPDGRRVDDGSIGSLQIRGPASSWATSGCRTRPLPRSGQTAGSPRATPHG